MFLSFVSKIPLALCKQKQMPLLESNSLPTLLLREGENQLSLRAGSLLSSESSVKLK